MESIIRLFKALPITKKGKGKINKTLLEKTVKLGFIFSPEVIYNYPEKELIKLIDIVAGEIGLSAEAMNSAFHKSWKKIKDANIEQLVIEQILHYITTYGFEAMGIYGNNTIYIPCEQLKIPKIKIDKISLTVIHGYTKEELKGKLIALLGMGVALKEETKRDVIDVVTFVELNKKEILAIKNKEVKCALCDLLDIFPEDPIEFLRYMIYKSINKTLLIKNPATIVEIKSKDNLTTLNLLTKYKNQYGFERLAEIFYRFKPLFLAFKTNKKLKSIINKIRKLANKYHKPMKEDYLNTITEKIKKSYTIDKKQLNTALEHANIFRKIRLAYALKFRTNKDIDSILYRIRNGKSYATTFTFNKQKDAEKILAIVIDSIVDSINYKIRNKKIYIPKDISYALPATEKQFTGDLPSGTYVSIPKDMIFGIHWEDVGSNRIDLDLSLINCAVGKIGWDARYRTDDRNILFSGDITAAPKPNGASELFYVKKQNESSYALFVNYYNHNEDIEVPFKIIVGSETVKNFNHDYMINPNNVICIAKSKIKNKQKLLGLIIITPEECRFYFTETQLGDSITSYGASYTENARKYLIDFYKHAIGLSEILEKAGAKLIDDPKKCDIDLSPEKIEKDTILNLIS